MDAQTLTTLFATTYSGDINQRRAAELEIRRVRINFDAFLI